MATDGISTCWRAGRSGVGSRFFLVLPAFFRNPGEVSALTKGGQRFFRKAIGSPPFPEYGADIGCERVLVNRLGIDDLLMAAMVFESLVIDERGFCEELLGRSDGLNRCFDFVLHVVALVDHVGNVGPG